MNDHSPKNAVPELEQLSQFLTYRVSRLQSRLNAQASKILRQSVGISLNQWRMLAFIGEAKQITASKLISYSAMDKGMVSRNVKTLIEVGLVRAAPHATDSRVHVLSATPAGQDVFDKALPIMRRRQAHLQQNLRPDDIATFRRVMAALEVASEETDV